MFCAAQVVARYSFSNEAQSEGHLPRAEPSSPQGIPCAHMEEGMATPPEYTLDEFRKAYSTRKDEAERIFDVSGPSRINLDIFMKVYRKRDVAEQLFVQ